MTTQEEQRLYRTAWNIVADGTLFKGAFVVLATDDADAILRTKAALGREGNAASVTVKASGEGAIELGRSEYPSDGAGESVPHVAAPPEFNSRERFAFELAARANVIAEDEDQAFRKLAHALQGKDAMAVKYLRKAVIDSEPYDNLSSYERHLMEKQFRSVRVAST